MYLNNSKLMKQIILFFTVLFLFGSCKPSTSQKTRNASLTEKEVYTVVYLFRHAEKDLTSPGANPRDPDLSADGITRAKQLARVLGDVDITHIFSSDYIRTRTTAAPLAELKGLEVETYNARELEAFAAQLKTMNGTIAVSGHSNTTPTMVKLLGGEPGKPIEEKTEYDRLYMVILKNGEAVHSSLMRYGEGGKD